MPSTFARLLPELLDEVHRLIETRRLRFVLSGSSARKLRRGGANLLAGRAVVEHLYPLVSAERSFQVNLDDALRYGTLPLAVTGDDPVAYLTAYAETYLQEEVRAEALTRSVGDFSRFLEIAARQNGQMTNVSAIARDAAVSRSTVQNYFEILIDTLIGTWLPAWTETPCWWPSNGGASGRNCWQAATERNLAPIVKATGRSREPLRGAAAIGMRVGKVINQHKMAKHFITEITEDSFTFQRDQDKIAAEEDLDGLYVVRSNVESELLDADQTVRAYKDLSKVERAFRSLKTVDLKVRPIYHRRADRVRAHVLLCSVVQPAQRSLAARAKASSKRTDDDLPVHSFRSLISELGTLPVNTMQVAEAVVPSTHHAADGIAAALLRTTWRLASNVATDGT